ncbi:bacillithiol biosynthesis deacetylase BshB1 [Sediminibacterium sp.]|uniref:bacillithiol biosynthesis deacetylase BshB1 n=1 Tax=Sediminibacterium sp. TaxID=1917865 RepID=UPI0027207E71|nr:bacillithiol biosynthesis deacetylase BshB1 [Sediminibacterium sp.]MDO9000580.1 bacillithiol biosynthesis deacetylase BshB1 [Bacteroidota bacterium]MDP3146852.1 bacillithiol biosynthesis deacetylase BshB1 [Bacteroidota bacterium]MDP3567602.1 bacillithiol biosynthesis deacetylase BshB1 [Sediminibacterium sp.]
MKIDILAIGVHPDDVELGCSGTIAKHILLGKKVGVLDLTLGELGTRGSAELRTKEATEAAKILGVSFRTQLKFKDGFFENNETHQKQIIEVIRKHQPEIILCNAINDRHPDHGRAAKLVSDACFYSGLIKIETSDNGKTQNAWRPKAVYHYIQDHYIHPDFVIDITDFMEIKHKAIMAFSSQFYNSNSSEPETPISSKAFIETINSKMALWGRTIGVPYAEGFTTERYPGVNSLFDLK